MSSDPVNTNLKGRPAVSSNVEINPLSEMTRVITVRLPDSLHRSIREFAHGQHKSMNVLAVEFLELGLSSSFNNESGQGLVLAEIANLRRRLATLQRDFNHRIWQLSKISDRCANVIGDDSYLLPQEQAVDVTIAKLRERSESAPAAQEASS
ncbi:MAG TPA: hypothetical protein VG713_06730 [Pirellulales bacterium]|nr:hypothetical protein [Pirellulales bacterium]